MKEWENLISDMIKKHSLYDCSFPSGEALRLAITECLLSNDQEAEVYSKLDLYHEETLEAMRRENMRTDLQSLVYVLNLAELYEVAEQLRGNDNY